MTEKKELKIIFIPLNQEHLVLLHKWFHIPHVKKWYARGRSYSYKMIRDKYLPRIRNFQVIPNYIVALDNHNIGYIQRYQLDNNLPEGINDYSHSLFSQLEPSRIAGIDLFIADKLYLGQGISSKILNQFIQEKVYPDFDAVIVDPLKQNTTAINYFLKNRFKLFKEESLGSESELLIRKLVEK